MQANELRIGNWVYCELSEKNVQIEGISNANKSFDGYYIEYDGGSKTCLEDFNGETYVSGIPITPEILVKAGFARKGNDFKYDGITITQNKNSFLYIHGTGRMYFKHLHDIQNLFHVLFEEPKFEL